MPHTKATPPGVNWDDFDAGAYWKSNYAELRADDRLLLGRLGAFFGPFRRVSQGTWHGVDVGSGPNLYPALSMLPLCASIDLREHGRQNCEWLSREVRSYSEFWDDFWSVLRDSHGAYEAIGDARGDLAKAARVIQMSLFDLPVAAFDVGTMFFVAESITVESREFQAAVKAFARSLRSGAPFAAAFMHNSQGYRVSDRAFPALKVGMADVERCLKDVAEVDVESFGACPDLPLRSGYDGMILATGTIK